jgi:hypothetical protein
MSEQVSEHVSEQVSETAPRPDSERAGAAR